MLSHLGFLVNVTRARPGYHRRLVDHDTSQPEAKHQDAARPTRRLRVFGLRGVLVGAGEPAPPAPSASNKQRRKELTGRLAGLSLARQVWVLSLWPLLEQVLNFLVGTVDIMIAGRLDGAATRLDALDAISVGSYFLWLMTILQAAVGVGASAVVSRAIGASHRRLANAGAGQALLLGVGSGVFAAAVVVIAAPWIAALLGLKGEAALMAVSYIRITSLGIPMCGALFVGSSVLRAAGDTRSPFFAMLVVNVVNVTVSVFLAGVSYGPADNPQTLGMGLGVTGIAAGTAVAWNVGGLIVLGYLLSGRSDIKLRRHRLIPHAHTMRRIVRVALPNLGSQLGFWSVNFALMFYVSLLSVQGAFGAHMIAMRIQSVSFLPAFAISVAASTLTGQYLGLGDPDRARKATYIAMFGAVGLTAFCAAFFFFTPEPLVRLLSPDTPEHLSLAPQLLRVGAPAMPFFAVSIILGSAMQGAGDTRTTALINFSGLLTTRLIGAYVWAFVFDLGLLGIWIGMMSDLVIRGVVFLVYYRKGRWARMSV